MPLLDRLMEEGKILDLLYYYSFLSVEALTIANVVLNTGTLIIKSWNKIMKQRKKAPRENIDRSKADQNLKFQMLKLVKKRVDPFQQIFSRFNKFSPVSTRFHQFHQVFTRFNQFSPISTSFHPFQPVFTHFNEFSPVSTSFHPFQPGFTTKMWLGPTYRRDAIHSKRWITKRT